VKKMYYYNNDYTLKSEYNTANGYVIGNIPQPISSLEYGTVLFGEDPGHIIDDLSSIDRIEKLSR
jgi:hypothetical protein